MESSLECNQNNLIMELSRGRELARQLQIHLNVPSSSHEARELLAHKLINSYDKILTMLKWNGSLPMAEPQSNVGVVIGHPDSPGSFSGSPKSEDSDRDFKDPEARNDSKKRKSMPRWTQQVQVCQGTGLEGPLDDGYSWRKYGQKDILGAKFPRSYYRCTHRNVHGCLATKQVQRSDDDPMLFEITNRGRHTCNYVSSLTQATPQLPSPEKKLEPNTLLSYQQQMTRPQQTQNQNQPQEIILSFKTGLKVLTEDLQNQNHNFPTNNNFHFPSASHVKEQNVFVSPSIIENKFSGIYFSPQTISPNTSLSNYYSLSPSQVGGFGEARNMNGSDSELMDIVSRTTSVHSSPTIGLDFPFGPMDPFEPRFSFDNPCFFSNF